MKAIVITGYGDLDVFEQRDLAKPTPGPGQILVEVYACGLNPVDFKIRQGHLKELFAVNFPRVLGGDISGVVVERGPDATDFQVGDEVYFSNPLHLDGGYAEFCTVDQSIVAKKPTSISHVEAASLPVVGLTSVQAIRDFGEYKKGQKVLIHAGAGGVGSFAIQYAKSLGAKVFTTASKEKRNYVAALGADHVIDYKSEDFVRIAEKEGGMDIVVETLGGLNYAKSMLATKNGGFVPCIVNPPDADVKGLADKRGIKTDFLLLHGNRADLTLIAKLVDEGKIRPTVSTVLTLDQIPEGHKQLESGRTQGKIVVKLRS